MVAVMDPHPQHRLSLARIAEAAGQIDPVFTGSPEVASAALSARLGCQLTLKLETLNPIRSFKGRGTDFFVGALAEPGRLVCASAGNFGQGMAYACRKRGRALTVFAARAADPAKLDRMRGLGADVVLAGGDLSAAKQAARGWAAERGARFVEDGAEPRVSEGAGTIAVELLARGAFDAVVVPLGDGALINGMARWIKAVAPRTRVIGVTSRGAPAFARAWRGEPTDDHAAVATIADGIAIRMPIAAAVADARGLVDDLVAVDDPALTAAMRLVIDELGVVAEPSGAAGVAAILTEPARFAGATVASVVTGSHATFSQLRTWLP